MKSHESVRARVLPRNVRQREISAALHQAYDNSKRPANDTSPWHGATLPRPALQGATLPFDLRAVFDLPMPSEARLKSLFDLTTAEARIAQRLACGDSVEEAAQRLNIKMTTARTQLAAIFAKTDTRRQAKLVAILSRVAHLG